MQRHPTVGSERLGRGKRGLGVVGRRQVRGTAGVVREEAEKRERERGEVERASYTRVNALAVRRAF